MNKFLQINTKTLQEYGVTDAKSLWTKALEDGFTGLSMEVETAFTKSADSKSFDVTFSTADEDRHGDIVEQNFDLKWFKKNPVLLDSHNYGSIEHIIGKVKNIKQDTKLHGSVEFATMNPKGLLAQEMADAGFINATSIGFIPKEFDDKGRIIKSELLEISCVSVPANARALFEKVADDTKKEIETLEKEITDETPVTEVIETIVKIDKKKIALNSIMKALKEMEAKNIDRKRTQIFKALRQL
jgi:phage head maturation protease